MELGVNFHLVPFYVPIGSRHTSMNAGFIKILQLIVSEFTMTYSKK